MHDYNFVVVVVVVVVVVEAEVARKELLVGNHSEAWWCTFRRLYYY